MTNSKPVYVDRESARFGMVGGLCVGFALGAGLGDFWTVTGIMGAFGLYSLYRSRDYQLISGGASA